MQRPAPLALVGSLSLVIACSHHGGSSTTDASGVSDAAATDGQLFYDAYYAFCDAPAGSAQVTVTQAGTSASYDRMIAAGVWLIGPVAPTATPAPGFGAPMLAYLTFSNAGHLTTEAAACCQTPGTSCCTTDGVIASAIELDPGAELGPHAVTFYSANSTNLTLPGTLTVTEFVQPYEQAPGRIAGTVSGSASGNSITGTFDHAFCLSLLTATI